MTSLMTWPWLLRVIPLSLGQALFSATEPCYSGDTMIIRVGDNGDEVLLRGFDPNAADTGPRAVQTFRFDDGTTISYEDLLRKTFAVQGDFGDDYLSGQM